MKTMGRKIAITVGDKNGVGPEVVQKALSKLNLPFEKYILIDGDDSYTCLKRACELANKGEVGAIVTGPVSKEALHRAGYEYSGQTEVLGELLQTTASASEAKNKPEMLFIASDLRVMLLTRHLPLSEVPNAITGDLIIEKTLRLHRFLCEKLNIKNPKIAFCALNPHAGENGILGREEITVINPALKKLREKNINVTDAISADGLFAQLGKKYLNGEKQQYDAVISTYHDQALTAIKAIAGDEVVNTTIGLKVIRTSPSHGTAVDIAGKGIANPASMIEAIKLALSLS